jgi:hypothetical protein
MSEVQQQQQQGSEQVKIDRKQAAADKEILCKFPIFKNFQNFKDKLNQKHLIFYSH